MPMPKCTPLADGTENISFPTLMRKLRTPVTGDQHVVVLYMAEDGPAAKLIESQDDVDDVIKLANGDTNISKLIWCGSPTSEPNAEDEHTALASLYRW